MCAPTVVWLSLRKRLNKFISCSHTVPSYSNSLTVACHSRERELRGPLNGLLSFKKPGRCWLPYQGINNRSQVLQVLAHPS